MPKPCAIGASGSRPTGLVSRVVRRTVLQDVGDLFAGTELSFIHQDMVVFQIQLTKRLDAVPLTRDYMALSPVVTGSADRASYPRLVQQAP